MASVYIIAALLLAAGCTSPGLVPAPEAERIAGDRDAARARQGGVELAVDTDAWYFHPSNLEDEVIPIKVTVRNDSDQPIAIRYGAFTMTMPDGEALRVLPPRDIDEDVTVVDEYAYIHDTNGFAIYDQLSPYYPGWASAPSPYRAGFDSEYYSLYYQSLYGDRRASARVDVDLPTADMVRHALPEGVLEPGGQITGFIYLEEASPDLEDERMTLRFEIYDARSNEKVDEVDIPFVAEG